MMLNCVSRIHLGARLGSHLSEKQQQVPEGAGCALPSIRSGSGLQEQAVLTHGLHRARKSRGDATELPENCPVLRGSYTLPGCCWCQAAFLVGDRGIFLSAISEGGGYSATRSHRGITARQISAEQQN